MTTYSAYNPEVVQLIGGLDFVTPRPNTAPGALIDCYNFEVADKLGYKRVDGVEPFDGNASISNCYSLLYKSNWTAGSNVTIVNGRYMFINDPNVTSPFEYPFARVVSSTGSGTTSGTITYYIFDVGKFLSAESSASVQIDGISSPNMTLSGTELAYQFDNVTSLSSAISTVLTAYTSTFGRQNISATSSEESNTIYYNPAIGLTGFKNQEYEVVDCASILFNNGVYQIHPGDYLSTISTNIAPSYVVREITLISGDWTTGDAAGKILYSNIDGSIANQNNLHLASHFYVHIGTSASIGTLCCDPTNNLGAAIIPATDKATMHRSYGPEQASSIAASPNTLQTGWWEVDLGWITQYSGGTSNGPFTKVGRESNPAPASITPTSYAFASFASGNLVDSAPNSTQWLNNPAASFPANVQTQNDGDYISSFSNSGSVAALTLSDFAFADLPVDTLVTGIELSISAFNTPKVTTTSGYTIAATSTTGQSIAVSGISGLNGKLLDITDGTHTITVLVTGTSAGHIICTIANDRGFSGQTMASGAHVNYAASNGTLSQVPKFNATLSLTGSSTKNTPVLSEWDSGASTYYTSAHSQTFTLGGSNDLWGLTAVTASDLQNSGFGVTFAISGNVNSAIIGLDVVKIRIYYQTTSSVYYFYNGIDDVKGTITTYSIASGDFSTNDAAGYIQIANVTPNGGATRNYIQGGDQIWTAPLGTGSHIANVSGNMSYAGLPSFSKIQAASSQYEFIEADFYGNTEWEAIYGCSGAGRAFTYDSFYFRYIYTNPTDSLDIPRHLAFHNFQLALGFKSGDLEVSATGLPEDFSGVDGAVDLSTGDPITGLLRMSGTTLGIFCRGSIQALNGTDPTNFSMSVLNPYEGAIEYTVVDGGNSKPIYASYKGISTFDQSNTYGNFLGSRLSANITSWLLPRLTGTPQPINTQAGSFLTASRGPLFATTIRSKNQYRLWFADGYYLTMTLMGQNQDPVFTIQQVNFNYTNNINPDNETSVAIPLANSYWIDSNGRDRNHFSIYNPLMGRGTVITDYANYVWEIDRGWGFGPNPIRGWFTTTHNFFDNPFQIDNPRKVRLHGQSLGIGTLDVSVSADYESGDFVFGAFSAMSNAPAQDISLPRGGGTANPAFLTTDYQAQTNIANIGKRGRSFSLQFSTDPSTVEPPTVCQALLIQTTLNKADV